MHLQTLQLTNFKNYESIQLDLSPTLNCFVGQNGMGKTNLLDAIYYLCMCKSHFGLTDRHLMKRGETFFRLDGGFRLNEKLETVVCKVIPRKKKTFERNKAPYATLSGHIGFFPVVMIAPDDTLMLTEGSEERRRFLDNTICQLDKVYLKHLILYNKLLSQRNKTLKRFVEERQFDATLLDTYDQQMIPPAVYINKARQNIIKQFLPLFNALYATISKEQETVNCTYASKLTEADFKVLLVESREKDRILQRTTMGIHRDDLVFKINDLPVKRLASQGQRKSYLLALKLAQYELLRQEKKQAPILLLDDIFDKLDGQRVQQLLGLLIQQKGFGQIFITDTHDHRVEQIIQQFGTDYKRFKIKNGSVKI